MSNNLVLIYHLHWPGYPLFGPWSLVKQSNKQLLSLPPFPVRHPARHPAHGPGTRIAIYINLNICVVDSSQLPLYPGSSCQSDQRGFRPICFPRISDLYVVRVRSAPSFVADKRKMTLPTHSTLPRCNDTVSPSFCRATLDRRSKFRRSN